MTLTEKLEESVREMDSIDDDSIQELAGDFEDSVAASDEHRSLFQAGAVAAYEGILDLLIECKKDIEL